MKKFTNGGGIEGGGASSDASGAGDNSVPQAIAGQHYILQLATNLQILPINPSPHMDDKPPTPAPPRRHVQRGLNRAVVPGPVLRHHQVRPDGRSLQQPPPVPGPHPPGETALVVSARLVTGLIALPECQRVAYELRHVVGHQRQNKVGCAELGEAGAACLEVGEGGAEPGLGVEVGALGGGVDRLVELLDRLFVELHAVGPRGLLAAVAALAAEGPGVAHGRDGALQGELHGHFAEVGSVLGEELAFVFGHEVLAWLRVGGLVAPPRDAGAGGDFYGGGKFYGGGGYEEKGGEEQRDQEFEVHC